MQREKLYNLHKTTYFIVALFFSEWTKFWRSNFYHEKKITFLIHNESIFCYFIVSSRKCFIRRKIKYTTRCSVKSSTIFTVKVIVIVFKKRKILCDQFLQCPKSGPSKLCPFWKQKVQLWNWWSCVNCRTFHAASYGMFWSLMQCIKGLKINLSHPLWSIGLSTKFCRFFLKSCRIT